MYKEKDKAGNISDADDGWVRRHTYELVLCMTCVLNLYEDSDDNKVTYT